MRGCQDVRERGDWEGWLAFFLEGIVEVSGQATARARQILLFRERHRQAITERLGVGRAMASAAGASF